MKKIIASVGFLAVGATALHAQYASQLTSPQQVKPWAVSAALRGFYDDNYQTLPSKTNSFGVEVSPSVSFNHATEQTYVGASYVYDLKYYERNDDTDNSHQANARFGHRFTPRYALQASESFTIGQDPQLLNEQLISSPVRIEGNNIRNDAKADFTAQITELLDTVFSYNNILYSFDDSGPGSNAALLDRMEHRPQGSLRWHMTPDLTGSLSYQFEAWRYTSSDNLLPIPPQFGYLSPATRNANIHKVFVGVDKTFTPQLRASLNVGAQYNDYYKVREVAPGFEDDTQLSPYIDAGLSYRYQENSYVSAGVLHTHTPYDLFRSGTALVLDAESTVGYASITHELTPRLAASGLVQYQHSAANPGSITEDFVTTGVNLVYQINPFLKAETGYEFTLLSSDDDFRGYDRNRVYLGIRGTY